MYVCMYVCMYGHMKVDANVHICLVNRYLYHCMQLPPKSAEGYADNVGLLYKSTPVIDFVTSDDHINLLGESGQLEFDGESLVFAKHPATTDEIRGYCEDVKVCNYVC